MKKPSLESYMLLGHDLLELEGIVSCYWCYCTDDCTHDLPGEECRKRRYQYIKKCFYKAVDEINESN